MNLAPKHSTANQRRLRLFRWTGLGLLPIFVVVGYFFWQPASLGKTGTNGKTGKQPVAVTVAVAETRLGDLPIFLDGLGNVTALHTVTVRPRIDGELVKVAFREGQNVRPGDLLAKIDPRPYQAQVQQAEGQLLRDEALLNNAELDLRRYQTLLAQDSIAAQQVATQSALVKQYRGTVKIDRAQLANAKLQLGYARITAPVAGRLGLRLVDQGNIVHASDSNGLVVITQLQPIAVIFTLPEDDVREVMRRWRSGKNLPVQAYDRAGEHKLAEGKLTAIDNQIDPSTGTVKLKAEFDNRDRSLFSNQFVNIKMRLKTLRDATLASTAAIQYGVDGPFVFVVNEDMSVTTKPVKLGPGLAETIVIAEGLQPGQKLVVDGADQLRDGSRVKIVERSPVPADYNPERS